MSRDKRLSARLLKSNLCRKGFTLIEVFLVAACFSLVLAAIFASYTSGIRVWKIVKDINFIGDRKLFIATEKMKNELSSYIRDFDGIEVEGDEENISFPGVSAEDGICKVDYKFDKGEDAVMRRVTKYSDSLKEKSDFKENKILDAEKAEFSYLFSEEGSGSWVTSFTESENGVPLAVKMKVEQEDKEPVELYVFIPK